MQVLLQIVTERRETSDVSQVHFVIFPSNSLQEIVFDLENVCATSQLEMAK